MSRTKKIFLLLPLLLGACESMPHMDVFGPKYEPITYEVARMAAPQAPNAAPPVYCRASKGSARFDGAWKDFATADFTVVPAARAPVNLSPLKGAGALNLEAYFDDDGQKIIFCPVMDGPPEKKIPCSSIYALEDDLQDGIKRTFDIPDAVQGGAISCAYDAGKLKK